MSTLLEIRGVRFLRICETEAGWRVEKTLKGLSFENLLVEMVNGTLII